MKKISLVAMVAAGFTMPALAADFPAIPFTKAPPMFVAIYNWSGFYIGANGGWGETESVGGLRFLALPLTRAATVQAAAWPAVRSAIAGRPPIRCSA
jgi:hypothetical protein